MKRYRHTPEQAVRKVREAERLLNDGKDLAEVLRTLEISEATWNRWRARYGGMSASEAKRLRELEAENARLKRLVANQALNIDMLKELPRETSDPGAAPQGRGPAAGALRGLPTPRVLRRRAAPRHPTPSTFDTTRRGEAAPREAPRGRPVASAVGLADGVAGAAPRARPALDRRQP